MGAPPPRVGHRRWVGRAEVGRLRRDAPHAGGGVGSAAGRVVGGGQVADGGTLSAGPLGDGATAAATVTAVVREPASGAYLHTCVVTAGRLAVGDTVTASVSPVARRRAAALLARLAADGDDFLTPPSVVVPFGIYTAAVAAASRSANRRCSQAASSISSRRRCACSQAASDAGVDGSADRRAARRLGRLPTMAVTNAGSGVLKREGGTGFDRREGRRVGTGAGHNAVRSSQLGLGDVVHTRQHPSQPLGNPLMYHFGVLRGQLELLGPTRTGVPLV